MEPKIMQLLEKLAKELENTEQEQDIPYREFTGALMWLAKGTHPDLLYAVSYLARFQSNYRPEHWELTKRILAYLCGTKTFGLLYSSTANGGLNGDIYDGLIGYSDADWAENDLT